MFDLRYHVASLTAVFVALVIGILVGVGLSGKGFVNDAERANLTRQIADLRLERDAAESTLDSATRGADALGELAEATYRIVVPGRLRGARVAVLFIGPIDGDVSRWIGRAVRDAGGNVTRTRSISVPIDPAVVGDVLKRHSALARFVGTDQVEDLGKALAAELVGGGKTPLWDALDDVVVLEREGPAAVPIDAVVVVRSAPPQGGPTKAFLAGIYTAVAGSEVPAIGVERSDREVSAIPVFTLAGLSTIDSVDTPIGRLGLVLLLAGAEPGSYGIAATSRDGVLPPISPSPVEE